MNIYLQISEHQDIEQLNLTATENNILNYIYHNLDQIDDISVKQIADNCHCSTAAIHRFVGKFGCAGFKQFKVELLSGKKVSRFTDSRFQINMMDLVSYIQSLNVNLFKDNLLKFAGKRVYVYGLGGSYVSAQYLVRQLNRFEIDASAYQPSDRSGLKDLADAVIFISHSGDTDELIDKAKQVKLEGIVTFAVTKEASRLAEIVDHSIVHNETICVDDFNQKESQLATMLLLEKIFYDLK